MEREDNFQNKMIVEFSWPSDEAKITQYLLNKHDEFKSAFLKCDIILICKIIESKHIINVLQDNGAFQKKTQFSLDWLYDWKLFRHIFSDKNFEEEFAEKIIHYLSKLYVGFSSGNWKKDRSFCDIESVCIDTVVKSFGDLIEFYNAEQDSSEIFKQRMICFIDIISRLKDDGDLTKQEIFSRYNDEQSRGAVILPLSPLSHNSLKSSCSSKIEDKEGDAFHEDSPSQALLTPVFKKFGDFIKDKELQGDDMNLDELKKNFSNELTGYIHFTNQRKQTYNSYYYGLQRTDPKKIEKAQTLLEVINGADSLAEIETSIDNIYKQLSQSSSYFTPAANSKLSSILKNMLSNIEEIKKQTVVEAKQGPSLAAEGFS